MSCSRRRSPPDRSRTSVRALSPRKPKRSHSSAGGDLHAAAERRDGADLLERLEHAQVAGDLGRVLREVGEADGRAALDRARRRLELAARAARSSVVLPEPLTPTSATRSPGPRRHVTSRSTSRSPKRPPRPIASSTLSPRRAVAKRSSSARSRGSGSSAISAFAASMRNFGLEVRAGGPRRSHASSLRRSCRRRRRARRPGGRARRARARTPRSRPRTGGRAVGDLPRARADGVEEPAVVGDDEHRAAAGGEVAREPVDGLDVEVVRRLVEQQQLGAVEQQLGERDPAPLATRQRRDRRVDARPGSGAARRRRAARRARSGTRLSAAHSWSARPPTSSSRIVRASSSSSPWPSSASCRSPARVTAPASGVSAPAMSRSSVDLPSPLRPTIPIRSPAATPSVMSRRTERLP